MYYQLTGDELIKAIIIAIAERLARLTGLKQSGVEYTQRTVCGTTTRRRITAWYLRCGVCLLYSETGIVG